MSHFEIIDDFLPQDVFTALRQHCDKLSYSGVASPVDGVIYPGISLDIPEFVKVFLGCPKTLFMRLSLKGVEAPHQAHTDSVMGTRSLMLYLNRSEHCQGGTSLVRHEHTGMRRDPKTPEELAIWELDTNRRTAWQIYDIAKMQPNRAAIFDAGLMHRAEPVGGFGENAQNGRLVLTAFY